MAETENFAPGSTLPPDDGRVAVVVPLFPRLPGLPASLSSLAAQTRPPDLVVLLDDGKSADAEKLRTHLQGLASEILLTGTDSLPSAVNAAVKYLAGYEYVTFLLAGDSFAPERIAHCLTAFHETESLKPPTTVISAIHAVDGRGHPLPPEDSRARHFERMWAPGATGVLQSEWMGIGNITATASNLFLRRDELLENPLPDIPGYLPYFNTISAAVQGRLAIIGTPLLSHNPVGRDHQTSARTMPDLLRAQLHLLASLRDKLADSPETRANFAAFHRCSWHNLSGLREDLFQQIILGLASAVRSEDAVVVASSVLRSLNAQTTPPQQQALLEDGDPLDFTARVSALDRTRTRLEEALEENQRLRNIAEAAQGSGWVRLGAWLGDRSARRMMELEESPLPARQTDDRSNDSTPP